MKRLLALAVMAAFVVTAGLGCSDTAATKSGTTQSKSATSSPSGTTETKKEEKKP